MSRRLYDEFVRPLDEAAQRAGAKLLVLWPDDALRYLPFGALHDGEHYLVEKYALELYSVDRQPGAALRSYSPPTVRGLGLTQAIAGFDALPAVAEELCSVIRGPIAGLSAHGTECAANATGKGALAGEGYADAAFTEARLTDLLSDPGRFSVLHIGTHFSLRPGNAMRSYLVLGDGSRLTLDRINALNFTGIGLATLSGCQTGMGGAVLDDGREVEGLNAIVLRKGAARVIASLWRVEDESTALLMRSMYTDFASKGDDVAVALQSAQRSLLNSAATTPHNYSHPYYWAGFVVSGSRR
jgi:CHAT domain-containing protein